ncbi:MAG TPA: SPOR domain-containing protein [Bacteroidia bacterium]|nr:SPOR domain-containing protein [Bacteroidia bacterium]
MKRLLSIIFMIGAFFLKAQNSADNDVKLKNLSDKCAEYHRKTDGETDGYRIKIHFALDKTEANEVKQKFTSAYSSIPAYMEYRQPNWVIVVGDFKTRVAAYAVYKKIQTDFPNAFIIKNKIKPIK